MNWDPPDGERDREPGGSEREYLEISSDRRLRLYGESTQQTLLGREGRWQLLETGDDLVVFQRLPADRPLLRLPTGRILLSGQLGKLISAVEVISFLQASRTTCWVAFVSGAVQKTLVLLQGNLLAVQSNQVQDRLGEVLWRFGYVDRETLDQALAEVGPQRRLGRILQEQGILTVQELWKNIRRQMEEVFYSVLDLERGCYHLIDAPVDQFPTRMAINTQGLVLEGLKRTDELAQYRKVLRDSTVVIGLDPRGKPAPTLDQDLRQLVEVLRSHGPMDLEQVSRLAQLGPHQGLRAAYEAIEKGLVRVQPGV